MDATTIKFETSAQTYRRETGIFPARPRVLIFLIWRLGPVYFDWPIQRAAAMAAAKGAGLFSIAAAATDALL
jgi:hypothetical protein